MTTVTCWCGHSPLDEWNADYSRCSACDTLVLTAGIPDSLGRVVDDDDDFYGREYWFSHQQGMGLPSIVERARLDMLDRIPAWTRMVLRHVLPPGKTLEIGCSHGAFVSVMRHAGFDATGLELSPAIARLARETFDVPVLVGPIEEQGLASGSLRAVVAFDVLEHLTDPVRTLETAAGLLDQAGCLFVQTPRYPEGATFEALRDQQSRFLAMLLPSEHTFLFSQRSISMLMARVGLPQVTFTPAVFAQYDMSLIASREPLNDVGEAERDAALSRTAGGRMVLALVDLDRAAGEAREALAKRDADLAMVSGAVTVAEADRAARLVLIEQQGRDLGVVQEKLSLAAAEIEALRASLASAEADRAARLSVIEEQGARLGAATAGLDEALARTEALRSQLEFAEADRAARLDVIHEQGNELAKAGARISELEAERDVIRRERAAAQAELSAATARVTTLQAYIDAVERSGAGRALRRMGWLPKLPPS